MTSVLRVRALRALPYLVVVAWVSSCAADPGDAAKVVLGVSGNSGATSGSAASGAGTASGSATGTSGTFGGTTGTASGASGATGTVSGATGTVSGATGTVSGATGTVSGATGATGATGTSGAATGTSGAATGTSGSSGSLEAGATESGVTGDGCLANIPSTCPNCVTQNASDMPKCQAYLQCFATNGCDPTGNDSCSLNDGVCGPNTIGGGTAPMQAAVATFMCACQ